jgi:hypothetical protein
MSIENTVYDFCEKLIKAGGAFDEVQLHADTYEPIRNGKTIRIDELLDSHPQPDDSVASGMREYGARLDIQVVVTPEASSDNSEFTARREAANAADTLALELIRKIHAVGGEIGEGICNVDVRRRNRWFNVANRKTPVVFLRLLINQET